MIGIEGRLYLERDNDVARRKCDKGDDQRDPHSKRHDASFPKGACGGRRCLLRC
jgi:hypothetical protein